MRKLIAAILLLAFIGQSFNQGLYYLDYLIDTAAYARNCINKAKPKLQCNGKCQMMKKMQEEERKQQQVPELKLASKVLLLSSKNSFLSYSPMVIEFQPDYHFPISIGYPKDQPSAVFHPPSA